MLIAEAVVGERVQRCLLGGERRIARKRMSKVGRTGSSHEIKVMRLFAPGACLTGTEAT